MQVGRNVGREGYAVSEKLMAVDSRDVVGNVAGAFGVRSGPTKSHGCPILSKNSRANTLQFVRVVAGSETSSDVGAGSATR